MLWQRKKQEPTFVINLTEGQKAVIKDSEYKSKAFVPLQINAGNSVEVVQMDGGLFTELPDGKEDNSLSQLG